MKIIPSFSNVADNVKHAAKAVGNGVVAGGKETGRVVAQTASATAALVTMVALAVLTAVASPLYLNSKTRGRYESLRNQRNQAAQNFVAQTKAIVYKPVKEVPAAPKSRFDKAAAKAAAVASSATNAVKANPGRTAAAALLVASGITLAITGVPTVVSETLQPYAAGAMKYAGSAKDAVVSGATTAGNAVVSGASTAAGYVQGAFNSTYNFVVRA